MRPAGWSGGDVTIISNLGIPETHQDNANKPPQTRLRRSLLRPAAQSLSRTRPGCGCCTCRSQWTPSLSGLRRRCKLSHLFVLFMHFWMKTIRYSGLIFPLISSMHNLPYSVPSFLTLWMRCCGCTRPF
eukprot:Rmarinus@m.13362